MHDWLTSDERRALMRDLDDISEAHSKVEPLTGLETWFLLPGRKTLKPPPRWKMWLVSFISVYPLVVRLPVDRRATRWRTGRCCCARPSSRSCC